MGDQVEVRHDGAVAVLTLDKPETRNAFDLPMARLLVQVLTELAADGRVRCILLRGGGRHFCAGGDLQAMAKDKDPSAYILDLARTANKAVELLRRCDKVALAQLEGAVAGGGLGLALAADLRIASDSAKISLAFLRVGLSPDMGTTWTLPRIVGRGRTLEMAASHDPLPIMEAWRLGLVNRVVKADELEAKGMAWAQELAALPGLAVAEVKTLLNASESATFDDHVVADSGAISRMARTQDFQEGVRAFFEKRPPRFVGR